jgi:hypothetical protein
VNAGCNCGRTWTGLTQAHCPTCHAHFSSVSGFDRHRGTGRCADPATVMRGDGQPYFKAEQSRFGLTWSRNDPAGHYRNDRPAAIAIQETT